jgi:hypothetical protein
MVNDFNCLRQKTGGNHDVKNYPQQFIVPSFLQQGLFIACCLGLAGVASFRLY